MVPCRVKIDDKTGNALGRGFLVMDEFQQVILGFLVGSKQNKPMGDVTMSEQKVMKLLNQNNKLKDAKTLESFLGSSLFTGCVSSITQDYGSVEL